ncbi:TadE family protein [Ornithinibacillus sp. FSL M8-0202]|uniref:TadE family protein n=1 Tax=unclassified Ornithinibacillus TaxID=2620869 RepID=UPI0030CD9908
MKWLKKVKKNEDGSATIEFLGIVPIALLLLVIIWQFIVGVNAVVVAKSAVNEYAQVYSVTKEIGEARDAASNIINSTGDYVTLNNYTREPQIFDKEFTAEIAVNIRLVFIPDFFGGAVPTIPYNVSAYGRVIE